MTLNRKTYTLLFGAIAVVSGFLIGADGGLLNIALLYLRQQPGVNSDGQISAIAVAVPLGVMGGALLVGTLSDRFGRKKMLLTTTLLFGMGLAMVAGSAGFPLLLAGRLIQGIALGFFFGVVPVFLGESLANQSRGICTVLFQLSTSLGLFAAMAAGAWFHARVDLQMQAALGDEAQVKAIGDHAWRVLMLCSGIPAVALFGIACCGPESPRWLFRQGRHAASKTVLLQGREEAQAELEFREMQEAAQTEKQEAACGDSLWQHHYLWPLALGLAIFIFNNAVGTGAINYYSSTLFGKAGLSEAASTAASTWMALAALIGATGGLFLVNAMGRKALLGWSLSAALIAIAVGSAALTGWLGKLEPATIGRIIFGCVVVYQIALATGPGACGWLLVSELFPTRVRSNGMGLGVLLGSAANMGLVALFLPIVNHLGLLAQWGLWGGLTAAYLAFSLFLLPETRGKTLEEIEAMFAHRKD